MMDGGCGWWMMDDEYYDVYAYGYTGGYYDGYDDEYDMNVGYDDGG